MDMPAEVAKTWSARTEFTVIGLGQVGLPVAVAFVRTFLESAWGCCAGRRKWLGLPDVGNDL
jgi:hypothetical protein